MYKRQPNTLVVLAFKNGSRDQPARVAAPNLRMVIYYMCLIHHTHFNFTPKNFYLEVQDYTPDYTGYDSCQGHASYVL